MLHFCSQLMVLPMTIGRKTEREADPWMSLGEAARALGESRQKVLARAVKGDVKATHIAGRTLVDRESVKRLVRSLAA